MNRTAEARAAAAEVLRADPNFTMSGYRLVEEYTLSGESSTYSTACTRQDCLSDGHVAAALVELAHALVPVTQ